jgi:hypothetical protein
MGGEHYSKIKRPEMIVYIQGGEFEQMMDIELLQLDHQDNKSGNLFRYSHGLL